MSYLKKHIVNQIHDLESPLNERMTFEEVMQRREKKKRRLLLFWPRIVIVGGLFTAAGLGYFAWNSAHSKVKKSIVIAENHSKSSQKIQYQKQVEDKVENTIQSTKDNSEKSVTDKDNSVIQITKKLVKRPTAVNTVLFSQEASRSMGKKSQETMDEEVAAIISEGYNSVLATSEVKNIINPTEEILSQSLELISAEVAKVNQPITTIGILTQISAVTKNEKDVAVIESASSTPETSSLFVEKSAEIIVEKETEINLWLDIEALLALTHGKGLQMFEIPDPLSQSEFEAVFVDFEEDELNRYFKPGNFDSPYHLELSVGTGSRVLTNFDETLPLSVLGNQYNAHYQLSLLKDVSNGIQLALGMSYGEWEGNGQWQKREWNSYTVRDSSVLIGFPNPNDRQVIYFDSTVNELTTTQGGIKYQITKISIPIGFRKLMYLGKTPFRVAMQISPGRTIKSSGYYFSDFEFHSIDNQRLTTMDMKVAMGPSININRNFTVVLEPNANMQMFHDSRTNRIHSKSFYGFGFSLIRHFN